MKAETLAAIFRREADVQESLIPANASQLETGPVMIFVRRTAADSLRRMADDLDGVEDYLGEEDES